MWPQEFNLSALPIFHNPRHTLSTSVCLMISLEAHVEKWGERAAGCVVSGGGWHGDVT